jgi:hypothetical protein
MNNYNMIDRNTIRDILIDVFEERYGGSPEEMDFQIFNSLFQRFLESPCTFDITKPMKEQVWQNAREFVDSLEASERN